MTYLDGKPKAARVRSMEHNQFLFVTVESPTWLLYVSLLVIAVFFRFSRLLSVRNLDLVFLLLLSTALVVAAATRPEESAEAQSATVVTTVAAPPGDVSLDVDPQSDLHYWSSVTVLGLSILLIGRLIFDESFTRRPRLEQNLNQAGLTFLFLPAFSILMTGVFLKEPPQKNVDIVEAGVALLEGQESAVVTDEDDPSPTPTETILAAGMAKVAELSGRVDRAETKSGSRGTPHETFIARVLVVFAHTCVVLGLIYIGRKHYSSVQLGVSMSCLYLLLPCTAYNVHELSHVIPAACLIWAVAMYRKPAVAGILLGFACGTLFFAVFLLPVWAVFYGKKSRIRFVVSLAAVAGVVAVALALTSENTDSFVNKLVIAANWTVYRLFDAATPLPDQPIGQVFLRITLGALFFVMLVAMTVIPRKRNLENLLANSTALIVSAQLWYPEDVGSYVLWYLPLLLLVIFRPRLDRFVPPEDPVSQLARDNDNANQQAAGSLARVTLYH